MAKTCHNAQLFIDEQCVGNVNVEGWKGSWGMGQFVPAPTFQAFHPLFAEWSRLMHADPGPISDDVSHHLRRLECEMYRLRCRLYVVDLRQWREILILNIDGSMIEWKEGWAASAYEPFAAVGTDDAEANAGKIGTAERI